jgi:hypothetical protein
LAAALIDVAAQPGCAAGHADHGMITSAAWPLLLHNRIRKQ